MVLMGPAGTGKTYSLGSMAEAGVELFYLSIQESGLESLIAYFEDKGKPVPPNVHWAKVGTSDNDFGAMMENAKQVASLSFDALCKAVDVNRAKNNPFWNLLAALNDFTDERTGKSYGSILSWGNDRCIALDGLSGISDSAMGMMIGNKPVASEGQWGAAMNEIYKLLKMIADKCACHFVLISHVERELDQINGGTRIYMATLGRKLAPKLPQIFSEVVLATRNGDKWLWDTSDSKCDLKVRYLPVKPDNPPDFRPIITKWRKRKEAAEYTQPETIEEPSPTTSE